MDGIGVVDEVGHPEDTTEGEGCEEDEEVCVVFVKLPVVEKWLMCCVLLRCSFVRPKEQNSIR